MVAIPFNRSAPSALSSNYPMLTVCGSFSYGEASSEGAPIYLRAGLESDEGTVYQLHVIKAYVLVSGSWPRT